MSPAGETSDRSAATDAPSPARLAAALQQAEVCVAVMAGPELRFAFVNPAYERIAPATPMLGRRFRDVFPDAAETGTELQIRRVLDTGQRWRVERFVAPVPGDPGAVWEGEAVRLPPEAGQAPAVAVFVRNVSDRVRMEQALREREELYRSLFTGMTEGFAIGEAIIDAQGRPLDIRFLEVNDAFERQAGLRREATCGRPMLEVLPGLERSWIDTYCGVALGGPPVRFESYARDLDRHFSVYSFSPSPGRFAVLFTDVTERKRAEEEARASDRRKTEFLGVLSHELRNPLAPIRNSVYLLERAPPASPTAARARGVLHRQVDHLTRLIDDLLDVTRISRGKIALHRARVDACELARRTAEDLRSLFDDAEVALRVEAGPGAAWVDADPTRLAQILGNLLQNAVKFTPAGGRVTLSVKTAGGRVRLRVHDTGIGLEPAIVSRMFEPFAQADQGLARTRGGLGLGLALVKGLVELHGGTVQACSDGPGRGAVFDVELPLLAEAGATGWDTDSSRPQVG